MMYSAHAVITMLQDVCSALKDLELMKQENEKNATPSTAQIAILINQLVTIAFRVSD